MTDENNRGTFLDRRIAADTWGRKIGLIGIGAAQAIFANWYCELVEKDPNLDVPDDSPCVQSMANMALCAGTAFERAFYKSGVVQVGEDELIPRLCDIIA